jgi:histidine ammonia-lyase
MVVLNDRRDFTLETYRQVAWEGEPAEFGQAALRRITERRAAFERFLSSAGDRHLYGTTTLPGEGARTVLTAAQRDDYEQQFAAPPAAYGDPVPERIARGIVFARLVNFIEGHAGVRPGFARAVAEYLDGRPLGPLPARGHLWEIMALPHLLPDFVARFGRLAAKEPMAISNGCPAAAALLADIALAGRRRIELAEAVCALAAESLGAPHEHFAPEIAELWEDELEARAMTRMRELLRGADATRRPYQAPVSIRIIPKMLGAAYHAQDVAETLAATLLRSVTDNPVYLPPTSEHPLGEVWSTGGYHPAQAIQAIDVQAYAWANLCQLLYHQTARIAEDDHALAGATEVAGGKYSVMAQAAWAYEVRERVQPTLLPLTGGHQTDGGSMSFAAWTKASEVGRGLDAALAGVATASSEAFAVSSRRVPPALQPLLRIVRAHRAPGASRSSIGADVGRLHDAFTAFVHGSGT